MNSQYNELFTRNLGVFTGEEQERIRMTRFLIVGCGGIGAATALCLARTGAERFTLIDFDSFEASNTNRQMTCFSDTIGKNKAEMLRNEIMRINPAAVIDAVPNLVPIEDIEPLVRKADFVFPAADDFAYSLFLFRIASRCGKPALMVVPSGMWAAVTVIPPGGLCAEDIFGLPVMKTYASLKSFLLSPAYHRSQRFYLTLGRWRRGYFTSFSKNEAPPSQICPLVWTASSMGALETVKYITGIGRPVCAPRFIQITSSSVKIKRCRGLSLHALRLAVRRMILSRYAED